LLIRYKDYNSLKVAAITAGNNITGSLVDVDRVAVLCHRWGFKAVFDYAAVAPYVPINVGGVTPGLVDYFGFSPIAQSDRGLAYKDAVYFSPHKFIGGPQSSGILLAKKSILLSKKPARTGGGIVFFVDEINHEYVANVEELEEAGTPGVIQDIRAGLVF
jgi:selenocysteine lyase/cysteine desulfurase